MLRTFQMPLVFTILICCSRKKGFRNLFKFTIKAFTYTPIPHRPRMARIAMNGFFLFGGGGGGFMRFH